MNLVRLTINEEFEKIMKNIIDGADYIINSKDLELEAVGGVRGAVEGYKSGITQDISSFQRSYHEEKDFSKLEKKLKETAAQYINEVLKKDPLGDLESQ